MSNEYHTLTPNAIRRLNDLSDNYLSADTLPASQNSF